MDRFTYVMVLISIIMGLGITHVLIGVSGLIDRRASGHRIRIGWAYCFWLAFIFTWMIQFWWWEFRFSEFVSEWTIGLYYFLISYSICLFLLAGILVPRTWEGVDDLDSFLLSRRKWFYSIIALASCLDITDSLLKGGVDYMVGSGVLVWTLWGIQFIACAIGLFSSRVRLHQLTGAAVFFWQIIQSLVALPTL